MRQRFDRGEGVRSVLPVREPTGTGHALGGGIDEASVAQPLLGGFRVRVVPGLLPVPVIGRKRLGGFERSGSLVKCGEIACSSAMRDQKTAGPGRGKNMHETLRRVPHTMVGG